jgi:RecA-family ATPase
MKGDVNDTLRSGGADAVRKRHDEARRMDSKITFRSLPPLPYVNLALDPIPPREWLVPERIPMRAVSMLGGDGAIGKSILLMQLAGAVVLGRDWCGTLPEPGPVLYMSCEEDEREVCHRFDAVARHFGSTRPDLIGAGLKVLSFAGKDAVLGEPDRAGVIRPTALFEALRRDALQQRPKLIVVDTVADVFAGKEIDRTQVREFVTILRGLAIEADAALVLSAHPSLTGIKTDSGLSGSTGWHNSVRARMYFKIAPGDDPDLRCLEFKKNNYGPVHQTVVLRWRDSVYVVEAGPGTLQRLAAEAAVNDLFMFLLQRSIKAGRTVSDRPSPTYAPTLFAREPEAKERKIDKDALAAAMARLFAAGKIHVLTSGPSSRTRSRIEPAPDPDSNDPSNALPTPSNALSTHTPHTPPAVGSVGRGLEAPSTSNGEDGRGSAPSVRRPQTVDGYEVIGAEPPGTACRLCGSIAEPVYLIRNPFQGVRSEPLHEACAQAWFSSKPKAARDA